MSKSEVVSPLQVLASAFRPQELLHSDIFSEAAASGDIKACRIELGKLGDSGLIEQCEEFTGT